MANSKLGQSARTAGAPEKVEETEPMLRVPNEVWMKIFKKLTEKERVNAREVCKLWREVVDSHFEFSVTIHDQKMDLNRISELRINDLRITRLLEDKNILKVPGLLKKLKVCGFVSANNFQRIMRSATGLEELSISKFSLQAESLLGNQNLAGFSSLKILELLGFMFTDNRPGMNENMLQILTREMPSLEKLKVDLHSGISTISQIAVLLMEFVSRRQNLKSLSVTLVPVAQLATAEEAALLTSDMVPRSVQEALRGIQLKVLRITTVTKDLALWSPLLNAQTQLEDLKVTLNEGGFIVTNPTYSIGIPFQTIQRSLVNNATTLVSVELKDIRLSPVENLGQRIFTPLDASVFQNATNLKRLILCRNEADSRRFRDDLEQPSMQNLQSLPACIEALEISFFTCRSNGLQMAVENLRNLRVIKLTNTGSVNGLGVHGGIIKRIAEKPFIQRMSVQPVSTQASPAQNRMLEDVRFRFGVQTPGEGFYFDFKRFRSGAPQRRLPTVESTHLLGPSSNEQYQPLGNIGEMLARGLRIE